MTDYTRNQDQNRQSPSQQDQNKGQQGNQPGQQQQKDKGGYGAGRTEQDINKNRQDKDKNC